MTYKVLTTTRLDTQMWSHASLQINVAKITHQTNILRNTDFVTQTESLATLSSIFPFAMEQGLPTLFFSR